MSPLKCMYSLFSVSKKPKSVPRITLKSYHTVVPNVCLDLHYILHANGLILVVDMPMDGRKRFRGHRDYCDDVLDTLPQENWVRKVSF